MLNFPRISVDLLHGPCEGGSQRLVGNSTTSLADGRQPLECPRFCGGLLELLHQQGKGKERGRSSLIERSGRQHDDDSSAESPVEEV